MPIFDSIKVLPEVEEYHVDSTYKISHTGHELFGIVAQVNGIGIPIAYFLLKLNNTNTNNNNNNNNNHRHADVATTATTNPLNLLTTFPTSTLIHLPTHQAVTNSQLPSSYVPLTIEQEATHSEHIVLFFSKLREVGLNPHFMFTDKDEGQITAIAYVWGEDAV